MDARELVARSINYGSSKIIIDPKGLESEAAPDQKKKKRRK